jgi:hypothetical protein
VASDGERKLAGNAAILRYFAHSSQKARRDAAPDDCE